LILRRLHTIHAACDSNCADSHHWFKQSTHTKEVGIEQSNI